MKGSIRALEFKVYSLQFKISVVSGLGFLGLELVEVIGAPMIPSC